MKNTIANGQLQSGDKGSYRIIGRGLDFDPSRADAWKNAKMGYGEPGSIGSIGVFSFTDSDSFNINLDVHPISGQIWTNNAMLHVYAPDPSANGEYTVRSYPVGGQGSTALTIPVGRPSGDPSLDQVSFAIVPTSDAIEFGLGTEKALQALGLAPSPRPGIATAEPPRPSEPTERHYGAQVEACEKALVESRLRQDYGAAKNPALLNEIGDDRLRKSMQDRVAQQQRQGRQRQQLEAQ